MPLQTPASSTAVQVQGGAPRVVINLLQHGPAYELLSEGRTFLKEWSTSTGQPVGIVNREWPGDLGRWVLRTSDQYRWELWQPDTRADRPYSHQFDDGVIHRLFPAQPHIFRPGVLRPVSGVISPELLAELDRRARAESAAVVLHSFGAAFWDEILDLTGSYAPTLMVAHGTGRSTLQRLLRVRHPLTAPAILIEHARMRRRYARLGAVTTPNGTTLSAVRSVYRGPIHRLTMGCDFEFWTPPPDAGTRAAARAALGIPPGRTVMITAAFLRQVKQVDRLIEACLALGQRDDFTLLVVGQGDAPYVASLESLGGPLVARGQLQFHPYVAGEALRRLLWAADLFVSSSKAEGASVAVMEAMACGLPVVTTPVGGTYEFMQRHGAGCVLPAGAFHRWPGVVERLLAGQLVPRVEREVARAEYDWRSVATRFVAILDEVTSRLRAGSPGLKRQ
jgi:glycosyltransferase involved in cell wall biosynthesis